MKKSNSSDASELKPKGEENADSPLPPIPAAVRSKPKPGEKSDPQIASIPSGVRAINSLACRTDPITESEIIEITNSNTLAGGIKKILTIYHYITGKVENGYVLKARKRKEDDDE